MALAVVILSDAQPAAQPALAFAGMVRVDLFVQMFRMMFVVALILACFDLAGCEGPEDQRRILRPADLQHGGHGLHGGVQQHRDVVRGPGNDEHRAVHAGGLHPRISVSTEAGLKYFLFGAFTSTILLYGLSLLFGFTGGKTNYGEIAAAVQRLVASQETLPVMVALVLITVGFGFKVAAVPFHYVDARRVRRRAHADYGVHLGGLEGGGLCGVHPLLPDRVRAAARAVGGLLWRSSPRSR